MAMADDQREIIDFLSRPSSYGAAVERVEIIETHVSLVFLAGDRGYKLKRAIKFPYLDFSSAEQRRIACEAELALNRRTAPTLYLEVRALTRTANGGVGFGTEGRVVDWVVVMRRFDQAALFDELAKTNRLNAPLMNELADHIAAFHQAAESRPDHGGAAALAAVVETNHLCLTAAPHAGFVTEDIVEIRERSLERLAAMGALLDRRRTAGKVRRCHGDLHLRNVCLFEGKPTLFDCLEFSDELASVDVLCDLAFLLMDLDHCGFADFANLVLNRNLDLTGEDDGLAAMPLFLSSRAAIRAHVTATTMERSAGSEANSEIAAELANKHSAELFLLTVVPDLSPGVDPAFEGYARMEHIQVPATELALAATESVLDGPRRAAQAKGVTPIAGEPSFGDPAQEIIAAAGDRQADLIIVGSRGHGRLAGLLLGSVAHKVISLAPCPTVVVR